MLLWIHISIFLTIIPGVFSQIKYNVSRVDLFTFPTDITADTEEIYIQNCHLTSFLEDSFAHFVQLVLLNLNYNGVPYLPNLMPVGNTLEGLHMVGCAMTQLNATVFNELRVLSMANFRGCQLTSFPDVPIGPRSSLRTFQLTRNQLTTFPPISNYSLVGILNDV